MHKCLSHLFIKVHYTHSYISLLIIFCIIEYVTNKTLNYIELHTKYTHCNFSTEGSIYNLNIINIFGMLNCYFIVIQIINWNYYDGIVCRYNVVFYKVKKKKVDRQLL